jgi:small subunit ribosomal protein S6
MTTAPPIYDLTLLLSTAAEEGQRAKVLETVQSAIANAGGQIERNDEWGRRPMAYQIGHQAEADYHLLQFTAPPSLIEELSHTLTITDGVLRFRVIRVRPGTPPAPSSPPPVVAMAAAPAAPSSPAPPAAASEEPARTTPGTEADEATEEVSGPGEAPGTEDEPDAG